MHWCFSLDVGPFGHLCYTLLFSGMLLKIDVFQSFSFKGRFETPWLESLGFANQREETTCHWNVYPSNVITCERDKEGQVLTSKLVSHCKVSFPFHHFQGDYLPWDLLSRWICGSVVRSSHAADLFSHILSPVVRERECGRGQSVVTLNYYSFTLSS